MAQTVTDEGQHFLVFLGRRLTNLQDGKKRSVLITCEDDTKVAKPDRRFEYVREEGRAKAIGLTEDN
jgi:hypothetical protein